MTVTPGDSDARARPCTPERRSAARRAPRQPAVHHKCEQLNGQAVPNVAVNLFNLQCGSAANCPSGASVGRYRAVRRRRRRGHRHSADERHRHGHLQSGFRRRAGAVGNSSIVAGGRLAANRSHHEPQPALPHYCGLGPFQLTVTPATPTALACDFRQRTSRRRRDNRCRCRWW